MADQKLTFERALRQEVTGSELVKAYVYDHNINHALEWATLFNAVMDTRGATTVTPFIQYFMRCWELAFDSKDGTPAVPRDGAWKAIMSEPQGYRAVKDSPQKFKKYTDAYGFHEPSEGELKFERLITFMLAVEFIERQSAPSLSARK